MWTTPYRLREDTQCIVGVNFFLGNIWKKGIYVKRPPPPSPPPCFEGRNNGNVDKRNLPKKFKPLEGGQNWELCASNLLFHSSNVGLKILKKSFMPQVYINGTFKFDQKRNCPPSNGLNFFGRFLLSTLPLFLPPKHGGVGGCVADCPAVSFRYVY